MRELQAFAQQPRIERGCFGRRKRGGVDPRRKETADRHRALCPRLLVQFARAALLAGRCRVRGAAFCKDAHAATWLRRARRCRTGSAAARTTWSARATGTESARTATWRRRLERIGEAHDVGANGFGVLHTQCLLERQHARFGERAIDHYGL